MNKRHKGPIVAAGFNISRNTKDIELPAHFKSDFVQEYTHHQLYSIGRRAIRLVKRAEVIQLVSKSDTVRRMHFDALIKLVLEGVDTSLDEISVTPQTLIFKKPNKDGNRKIAVLIEDDSALQSERDEYLRILSKLCRAKMPRTNFRPEVEVGQTTNAAEPNLDALRDLALYIPEYLKLEPARSYPAPTEWYRG